MSSSKQENHGGNKEKQEHSEDQMTLTAAWSNLSNCAVGSGILSIPFAFAQMGIVLSFCVYIIITLCSWIGMYLLARTTTILWTLYQPTSSQHKLTPKSYRDLTKILLGPIGAIGFQFMMITYTFSILVGYLMIIEELIPQGLRWLKIIGLAIPDTIHTNHFTLLSAVIGIILPISMIRTRYHFKYFSAGAIFCVIYFMFLLTFESSLNPFGGNERMPCWKHEHDIHLFNDISGVIIGVPIICLALGGHLQSVNLFTELTQQYESCETEERNSKIWNMLKLWAYTTGLSMIFLTIIYTIVGSVSYICMIIPGREPYGADILQHMIDSDPYDGFIQSASLSIAIILVLSYPLFIFPLRGAIDEACISLFPLLESSLPLGFRYNVETFLIVMSSYLVAITIGDVKVIFGVIGAIGAVLQQFILPSVLYLLTRNYSGRREESRMFVVGTFIVLVVGCIVTTAAAMKIIWETSDLN